MEQHKAEQIETSALILDPKVGDIYVLDMNLVKSRLEHKNKYKLEKVIRVSNGNIAMVYGRFFHHWKYAVVNSIEFGNLSNSDYFTLIPDYISFNEIKEVKSNGAMY